MEHSLLSPKVDIIFKKIFGDILNKSILISFLNAVLGIDKEILTDLEIINSELLPDYYDDKVGVLDIKVKLKSGELINIEIQIANQKNMIKRIHYYISKLYYNQITKGSDYSLLNRCINITIVDFNLLKDDVVHHIFNQYDKYCNMGLSNLQEIHTLELRKIKSENNDILNLWLKFIDYKDMEVIEMACLKDEEIKKAYEVLERLSKDPKTREIYELREKWEHDEVSWRNEARRDGLEEGRIEGRIEGIKEGVEKIAINMLNENFDLNTITKVTGLNIEEIKKLS